MVVAMLMMPVPMVVMFIVMMVFVCFVVVVIFAHSPHNIIILAKP